MGGLICEISFSVKSGLDFLLGHFDPNFLFPRNISTKATNGGQRCVFSKEAVLASYERADFMDCRISAYPNQKYVKHIRQKPDFLFIDIDDHGSNNEQILKQTLENIKDKFENDMIEPTVVFSGSGGYHIYLPVNAIALEQESLFEDIEVYDPSRKFMQWAEQYLSNNKADPCHSKGVSFKNCMLRVPGSINSKMNKEVRIVQCWNGVKPGIKPLLYEFYIHVADMKLMEIQGFKVKQPSTARRYLNYWKPRK